MKTLCLCLLISFWAKANPDEKCPIPGNGMAEVTNCLKDGINVLSNLTPTPGSKEAAIAAASLFLDKYKDSVEFEVSTAGKLLENLKKFTSSDKIPAKESSQLWLIIGAIHGRISDKLRASGGAAHGTLAIQGLKKSLTFDKNNKNASLVFGLIISSLSDQHWTKRPFIELAMGINIGDEVKKAMSSMEENGLKDHPTYKKLKSF